MKKEIYLDGASNTPIDEAVLRAMKPFLASNFMGNSNSPHDFGIKADQAIYKARSDIASCVGCTAEDVFFTSGATESNNWVIKSIIYDQLFKGGNKKHIICSAIEHDSVLNCCKQAEEMGMEVTYVHLQEGHTNIDLQDIAPLIRPDTCLICVMSVNNETGIENDIEKITMKAAFCGIPTLIDCTQLVGYGGQKIELSKLYPYATFFSFSSHKIYGPTGVGCLIRNDKKYKLNPLIIGGAQEQGVRGGTSNTAGIVGLGAAVKKIHKEDYSKKYQGLLRYLQRQVSKELPGVYFNVWPAHANIISLNCSNIINADNLSVELANYGIAVSAGSACNNEHNETDGDFYPSHVLREMKLTERQIRNTIRISFTKYTNTKDIDRLIEVLKEVKQRCK